MKAAKSSVLKIEVTQGPALQPWEIAARERRIAEILARVAREVQHVGR